MPKHKITSLDPVADMMGEDPAANLGHFLTEMTGTPSGVVKVWMNKEDQLALTGHYFGRMGLWIDGEEQTIESRRKIAFGQDSETVEHVRWDEL